MIKYIKMGLKKMGHVGDVTELNLALALKDITISILETKLSVLSDFDNEIKRITSENERLRGMVTARQEVNRKLEIENRSMKNYMKLTIDNDIDFNSFIESKITYRIDEFSKKLVEDLSNL